MKRKWTASIGTLLLGFAVACSSGEDETVKPPADTASATAPTTSAAPAAPAANGTAGKVGVHPKHKPAPAVTAKGKAPKPPAGAQKKKGIGKGELALATDNTAADTDSSWVEEIDIDGDGDLEQTDLLYDDEDKVLYLFAEDDFSCADGQSEGSGGMLMAVYGPDNRRGAPAGSGWYLADLDEGECNAQEAALWGCDFDADGNRTACGLADARIVDDEIVILDPDASAAAGQQQ